MSEMPEKCPASTWSETYRPGNKNVDNEEKTGKEDQYLSSSTGPSKKGSGHRHTVCKMPTLEQYTEAKQHKVASHAGQYHKDSMSEG